MTGRLCTFFGGIEKFWGFQSGKTMLEYRKLTDENCDFATNIFGAKRPIRSAQFRGEIEKNGRINFMKRANRKRIARTSGLLAALFLLGACGNDAPSSTPVSSENPSSVSSAAEESSAPAELEYVKLKYVNYGDKPSTGNYDEVWAKINEMLKEDLNCEVEVEWLGSADAQSKLAMKYAGNEIFDFAYDASWLGYVNNASQNAFREITMEEIEEYMPLVKEQLPDIAWQQSKVGGKIYMIPVINYGYNYLGVLIRGDICEKYGLGSIETAEDFEKYCYAIAENEPGMEAIGDVTYLDDMLYQNPSGLRSMITGLDSGYHLQDALAGNYEVTSFMLSDVYMDYCKKMRQYYQDGLWSADAIADTIDSQTKFSNGLVGTVISNMPTLNSVAKTVSKEHPEWNLKICYFNKDMAMVNTPFIGNGTTLNRLAENPERAMMVTNLFYGDPEYNHLLQYGIEGLNYEVNGDGKMVTLDTDEANTYTPGCNWNYANTVIGLPAVDNYPGYDDIMDILNAHRVEVPLQAFTLDRTNVKTEIANISAVMKENSALQYGMMEDVEAAVEQYRQELNTAGMQTVLDECNRQVADFIAGLK